MTRPRKPWVRIETPPVAIDGNISLLRCTDLLQTLFSLYLIPKKGTETGQFIYWEEVEYFCYVWWPELQAGKRKLAQKLLNEGKIAHR